MSITTGHSLRIFRMFCLSYNIHDTELSSTSYWRKGGERKQRSILCPRKLCSSVPAHWQSGALQVGNEHTDATPAPSPAHSSGVRIRMRNCTSGLRLTRAARGRERASCAARSAAPSLPAASV